MDMLYGISYSHGWVSVVITAERTKAANLCYIYWEDEWHWSSYIDCDMTINIVLD
jgi:hypothetical protein